jgi:hypothetical protein
VSRLLSKTGRPEDKGFIIGLPALSRFRPSCKRTSWWAAGTTLELRGCALPLLSPATRVQLYRTDRRPGWVLQLNLESQFVFHKCEEAVSERRRPRRGQPWKRSAFAQQLRAAKI